MTARLPDRPGLWLWRYDDPFSRNRADANPWKAARVFARGDGLGYTTDGYAYHDLSSSRGWAEWGPRIPSAEVLEVLDAYAVALAEWDDGVQTDAPGHAFSALCSALRADRLRAEPKEVMP